MPLPSRKRCNKLLPTQGNAWDAPSPGTPATTAQADSGWGGGRGSETELQRRKREIWSLRHATLRPEGETELLDLACERGSGFLFKGGERDRETTHVTYIQREAETDRKTRPRDDSTKRKREVEGGDGKGSYILKYQSENGVLLPFLGSKEFPGS